MSDGQREPFCLLLKRLRRLGRLCGLEFLQRCSPLQLRPFQLGAVAALVAQEAVGAGEAAWASRARMRGGTPSVDLSVAGQVRQSLELPLAAHALERTCPGVGDPVLA